MISGHLIQRDGTCRFKDPRVSAIELLPHGFRECDRGGPVCPVAIRNAALSRSADDAVIVIGAVGRGLAHDVISPAGLARFERNREKWRGRWRLARDIQRAAMQRN